jgi:uncharacterized membrane protein
MSEPTDPFGLERIAFFTDAVMAIAITLLALDIRLPPIDTKSPGALLQALLALWPLFPVRIVQARLQDRGARISRDDAME